MSVSGLTIPSYWIWIGCGRGYKASECGSRFLCWDCNPHWGYSFCWELYEYYSVLAYFSKGKQICSRHYNFSLLSRILFVLVGFGCGDFIVCLYLPKKDLKFYTFAYISNQVYKFTLISFSLLLLLFDFFLIPPSFSLSIFSSPSLLIFSFFFLHSSPYLLWFSSLWVCVFFFVDFDLSSFVS